MKSEAPAAERLLNLLECFSENKNQNISLQKLEDSLQIPPASLHRLVKLLLRRKYLTKDQDGITAHFNLSFDKTSPLSRQTFRRRLCLEATKETSLSSEIIHFTPPQIAHWLCRENAEGPVVVQAHEAYQRELYELDSISLAYFQTYELFLEKTMPEQTWFNNQRVTLDSKKTKSLFASRTSGSLFIDRQANTNGIRRYCYQVQEKYILAFAEPVLPHLASAEHINKQTKRIEQFIQSGIFKEIL